MNDDRDSRDKPGKPTERIWQRKRTERAHDHLILAEMALRMEIDTIFEERETVQTESVWLHS